MTRQNKIRVPYAQAVYGKDEIAAVLGVLKNPLKITAGPLVKKFETKIARLFGKRYGVMVNSGSSANLLALEVLNFPKGSEVITPALTFSTTLAPILQNGLSPVFADVEMGKYVINADLVEPLITKKTRALMIPALIGNVPDMVKLRAVAKKYNLVFIEDSCDTLGARFAKLPTGRFSDISTTSFYASHIITAAGGGGMVCFNDEALSRRALVKSNWGRDSTLFGHYEQSEEIKKRFAGVLAGDRYDAKFIFSEVGYNFQPREADAAFGLQQLKKLSLFKKIRQVNFADLKKFFGKYEDFFILPGEDTRAQSNWLAFPLLVRDGAPFTRMAFTKYLEENNIQTRPIFTGNVLRQPAFISLASQKLLEGSYPVTDYIMKNGFLVGCHQGLGRKQIDYLKEVVEAAIRKFTGRYA